MNTLSPWIRKHPLASFVIIAFGGAWVVWVFALLTPYGMGWIDIPGITALPLIFLGTLTGPFLGAYVVTRVQQGKGAAGKWVRQLFHWRFAARWYLLAIALPLVANIIADLGVVILFQTDSTFLVLNAIPKNVSALAIYVAVVPTVQLLTGPLGEEPGWRGFALPRMQKKWGPVGASLGLGVVWGLWHLPLLLFSEDFRGKISPLVFLPGFLIALMAFSVLITFLFNRTGGFILATMLTHAAYNTASMTASDLLFHDFGFTSQLPSADVFFVAFVITFLLSALVCILLTRGRLGYVVKDSSIS